MSRLSHTRRADLALLSAARSMAAQLSRLRVDNASLLRENDDLRRQLREALAPKKRRISLGRKKKAAATPATATA